MGQLERYGLYVLCVVIVLILGVAIWGGDPPTVQASYASDLDRTLSPAEDDASVEIFAQAMAVDREAPAEPADAEPGDAEPGVPAVAATDSDGLDDGFFDTEVVDVTGSVETALDGLVAVEVPTAVEAAVAAAPVAAASQRTYTIRSGDSMEKIARRVLNDVRMVSLIKELNPQVDPRRMRVGSALRLPSSGAAVATAAPIGSGLASWREYKVARGDNPSKISKAMYGTSRHAQKILSENGISDAKRLMPGTVLRIPPLN